MSRRSHPTVSVEVRETRRTQSSIRFLVKSLAARLKSWPPIQEDYRSEIYYRELRS